MGWESSKQFHKAEPQLVIVMMKRWQIVKKADFTLQVWTSYAVTYRTFKYYIKASNP